MTDDYDDAADHALVVADHRGLSAFEGLRNLPPSTFRKPHSLNSSRRWKRRSQNASAPCLEIAPMNPAMSFLTIPWRMSGYSSSAIHRAAMHRGRRMMRWH